MNGSSSASGSGWMKPFVTSTFFRPCPCASFEVSSTNSYQMSGSLYVYAMPNDLLSAARRTASSGDSSLVYESSWLMDQFWQCRHAKLQPFVPSERICSPG